MVLRKHIIGLRLKSIYTIDLERVIFIEFEGFNDIDEIVNTKLVIELMGKHSNIILVDDNNLIIDSLRHIKGNDENYRNILPHYKYHFPKTDKLSIYDINSYEDFKNNVHSVDDVYKVFNGISKSFINNLNCTSDLENVYKEICNVINNIDKLGLEIIENKKDYTIRILNDKDPFSLNFALDDFYTNKENSNNFKVYRDSILKLILSTLKKYNKRLINIDNKLKECENKDIYKLYGELITANLYKLKDENVDFIELENYYNNNNLIKIPLDKRYSPSENAKRYFKKYNKLKNALEIVGKQKEDTLLELDYIESVIYELQNASTLEEVDSIFEEISVHDIFKNNFSNKNKKSKIKKSQLTKNKTVKFNPIKYTIDNHTVFVGRNNIENDYLTFKFASKTDYWFHTKDIHGSHVILKVNPNETISDDLLIKCCQIAVLHSKARNSSNVPVDYCLVKFVKKPSGSKPGFVVFSNNKTLNVNPFKKS